MLLKNFKRCSAKAKEKYSVQVQNYLKQNGMNLVQKLYNGILDCDSFQGELVKELLGENYPIAPWVEESNIIGQFVSILQETGYVFSYTKNGEPYLKDRDMYSAIVKNHLKFSGKDIMNNLAECCDKTNGRISYEEMQEILGLHYPKAPYAKHTDIRLCIILFLKETNLPFKFDETHIYLP